MKRKSVEIEEVIQWHTLNIKGMSLKEVSKKYKRDYKTIVSWFNKYNISYISHKYKDPNFIYPIYIEYNKGFKSLTQLANENNTHIKVITRGWDYFNLDYEVDLKRNKGNNPNHNFFSNIDSEVKAYLLGFFAGDGHIEKRRDYDSYTLKVSVHKKDKYILDLYNKYVGNNQYNLFKAGKNLLSISITSKQIGDDLLKLGFDNRKTYTSFKLPNIPKKYMRHYIRGLFDADGSINKYTISFASYNKSLLLNLLLELPRISRYKLNYRTAESIVDNKCQASCWLLEISKKHYLPFLYNYFYKNSNHYFKRKHDRFLVNKNCSLV